MLFTDRSFNYQSQALHGLFDLRISAYAAPLLADKTSLTTISNTTQWGRALAQFKIFKKS
jgi:hypothetical protein